MKNELKREDKKDEVFEKSEALLQVLNKDLGFLLKNGMSILFTLGVVVLIITFLVTVPDKIESNVVLTATKPYIELVTQGEGRIAQLLVQDGEKVKKGQVLVIMSTGDAETAIQDIEDSLSHLDQHINQRSFQKVMDFQVPGSSNAVIQTALDGVHQSLTVIKATLRDSVFNQRRRIVEDKLQALRALGKNLVEQEELYRDDYDAYRERHLAQKKLHEEGFISDAELSQHKSALTTRKLALKRVQSQVWENQNAQNAIREQLLNLDQNHLELWDNLNRSLRSAMESLEALRNRTHLIAQTDGKVSFNKPTSEGDYKARGESLFHLIPNQGDYEGVMTIPQDKLGKLDVGNMVRIRLDGYNYMEYGTLNAHISHIAETPLEGRYTVWVNFGEGLVTDYGETIPFKNGLSGKGMIIIEETRLLFKLLDRKKA